MRANAAGYLSTGHGQNSHRRAPLAIWMGVLLACIAALELEQVVFEELCAKTLKSQYENSPMTETIESANTATSTLFLGHNGEWWDFALIISLVFVAIAAIAAGITTAGSIFSHKREALSADRAMEHFKLETENKIFESKARTAEAELKLGQLRKLVGPRGINYEVFKKELEGKPKTTVAIWYLPDSSDGYWFASQLSAALSGAGWPTTLATAIPDLDEKLVERIMPSQGALLPILRAMPRAINAGGQPSGVTVVGDRTDADINAPDTPFAALFNALAKSTTFGMYGSGGSQFMPVPAGTLRVVIAAKSDPMFVDTPVVVEPPIPK